MNIYLDKSQEIFQKIASLVGYKGHSIQVNISEHDMNLHSYWDGGSRDEYYCFDMNGRGISVTVQNAPLPFYDGPKADYIPSPDKFLIRHSTFAGKDMGLTLYLHPLSVMVKALPAPSKPDIPHNDLFVLNVIKCYKSFARAEKYQRAGFTQAEVDKTKERLFQQGYINKAGAITPTGRNIVERSFDGISSSQSFCYNFKKEVVIDTIAKEA